MSDISVKSNPVAVMARSMILEHSEDDPDSLLATS